MLRILRSVVVAVVAGAAACATPGPGAPDVDALTTAEVDIAPECTRLLTYVNTASFATLDAFLPSDVARAIVDTAAVHRFRSIADLLAVNGVGPTRLQQLLPAARSAGLVGVTCEGIYDELAVSQSDAAAIVDLVNRVTEARLTGVLAFLPFPELTLTHLLAGRPYASVGAIADTSGVGPATFRALRNAAALAPFGDLVEVVDSIDHPDAETRIATEFDWRALLAPDERGEDHITSLICFGIDPAELPLGATIRDDLAAGAEVHANVSELVAIADRFGEVSAQLDPAPGLAALGARTAQRTFFGCFIRKQPDPFTFDTLDFFVDTAGGFRVLTTIHAVE